MRVVIYDYSNTLLMRTLLIPDSPNTDRNLSRDSVDKHGYITKTLVNQRYL